LIAASQIFSWIYSIGVFVILINLFGSLLGDTFSSCSYGISLLYKPCLTQSFGVAIDSSNSFHARIQSCSDPGPGRVCLADFELSTVDQQCTVGSQALSSFTGKGGCGCKLTTLGKTSNSDVDAAIRAMDPGFASRDNNIVFCYPYEIPDAVPDGWAIFGMFAILLYYGLHLYSLWYANMKWDPPAMHMIQREHNETMDGEQTESGIEACPEDLWDIADHKPIVYNYNRDSILVLFMYAFRCYYLEVSYVNVYYMVVEANIMKLGDYSQIVDAQEGQISLVGLVVILLKDFSLWLPILFVAIKTSDDMSFWWWVLLLKGSGNLISTTYYLLRVCYCIYLAYNPQEVEPADSASTLELGVGPKDDQPPPPEPAAPPPPSDSNEVCEAPPPPPPAPPPPTGEGGHSGNPAFEAMFNR